MKAKPSKPRLPWPRVVGEVRRDMRHLFDALDSFEDRLADIGNAVSGVNALSGTLVQSEHNFQILRLAIEGLRRIRDGKGWVGDSGATTAPAEVARAILAEIDELLVPGIAQLGDALASTGEPRP